MLAMIFKSTFLERFASFRITKIALAATLCLAGRVPAEAQVYGVTVGAKHDTLDHFGAPIVNQSLGPYKAERWLMADGNDLFVYTDREATIVFIEADWGGKESGKAADFFGFRMGTSTFADIHRKDGDGIILSKRSLVSPYRGAIIIDNDYEIGGNVVFLITKADTVKDIQKILDSTLISTIVCSQDYAEAFYGTRIAPAAVHLPH